MHGADITDFGGRFPQWIFLQSHAAFWTFPRPVRHHALTHGTKISRSRVRLDGLVPIMPAAPRPTTMTTGSDGRSHGFFFLMATGLRGPGNGHRFGHRHRHRSGSGHRRWIHCLRAVVRVVVRIRRGLGTAGAHGMRRRDRPGGDFFEILPSSGGPRAALKGWKSIGNEGARISVRPGFHKVAA